MESTTVGYASRAQRSSIFIPTMFVQGKAYHYIGANITI